MSTRREFLASTGAFLATANSAPKDNISLALWSLHRSFFAGHWKLLEIPGIMRERLGITGLEHVNQFFENPTLAYQQKLKKACADNGVQSVILMVDNEGATAAVDKAERRQAEVAHRKWIDVAHFLECQAVRCNMYGGPEDWRKDPDLISRAAETFHGLLEYSKGSGLNIIVENHGRASSDPDVLVALVKKVNHPNFALLVDLGNWNHGDDRYAAVRKTLPYGRGLSVKGTWGSHLDPAFDLEKLVRTAVQGNYHGWWGIEVSARTESNEKLSAKELFEREVTTVREVKEIVQRTVPGVGGKS